MDGDRELLERAARAAGINAVSRCTFGDSDVVEECKLGLWNRDDGGIWNPLRNDGDALRLAVRMAQLYGFFRLMRCWMVCMAEEAGNPGDPYAATRRAIVRAAAAMAPAKESEHG